MSNYQLRSIIADVLFRVEKNKSFSHILIDHEIRANHFSAKDAALFTEIVYGTVQRQMTIDYYLEKFIKKNKKLDLFIKVLLRMSIYQMVFLDKVPDHAIIHEAVEVAKKRQSKGAASFVNGVLRNIKRKGIPN